jgi:outer membrane protein
MDVVRLPKALDNLNMGGARVLTGTAAAVVLLGQLVAIPVLADTMEGALLRAYRNNPQLNAQRASVRVTDENVPQALAGYRPKVAGTFTAGVGYTDQLADGSVGKKIEQGDQTPHSAALTVTQTLYNGNRQQNPRRRKPGFWRT